MFKDESLGDILGGFDKTLAKLASFTERKKSDITKNETEVVKLQEVISKDSTDIAEAEMVSTNITNLLGRGGDKEVKEKVTDN